MRAAVYILKAIGRRIAKKIYTKLHIPKSYYMAGGETQTTETFRNGKPIQTYKTHFRRALLGVHMRHMRSKNGNKA